MVGDMEALAEPRVMAVRAACRAMAAVDVARPVTAGVVTPRAVEEVGTSVAVVEATSVAVAEAILAEVVAGTPAAVVTVGAVIAKEDSQRVDVNEVKSRGGKERA